VLLFCFGFCFVDVAPAQTTSNQTTHKHTITSTGIPADRQQLSLGATGRPMLDVMCLSDYPQVAPGAANEVRVALAEGG
jgi:hypothetical protein